MANTVKVASSALASIPTTITSSLHLIQSQIQSLLPDSTNPYFTGLTSQFETAYLRLSPRTQAYLSSIIIRPDLTSPELSASVILLLISVVFVTMSRWTKGFWSGGGFSPFGSSRTTRVTDEDFSYITSDNNEAPHRGYGTHTSRSSATGDDNLILKHGKVNYPLHFPSFSIANGDLSIGALRQEAARVTGIQDPSRVRLFYKGKNLKDDSKSCLHEGLRTGAELMCMASERSEEAEGRLTVGDQETLEDEGSDTDGTDGRPQAVGDQSKRKRNRNRKKKNKKSTISSSGPSTPKKTSAGMETASSNPAPMTALEKLNDISSHFHTKLLPLCVLYTNNPPEDLAKREFEHRKLSETIFSEVMLKLDAVETEGDPEARQKRRDLVKETQGVLGGLDAVLKVQEA